MIMKRNLSNLDKVIRILAAIVIAVLYFTHRISGTTALVLGIIALALVITSFINFCPIYWSIGISSFQRRKSR